MSWTATPACEARYRRLFPELTHRELGAIFRPDLTEELATFWSQNWSKRLGLRKSSLQTATAEESASRPAPTQKLSGVPCSVSEWSNPQDQAASGRLGTRSPALGTSAPATDLLSPPDLADLADRPVADPGPDLRYFPSEGITRGPGSAPTVVRFGLFSDQHYGNHHERQDIVEAAYDHWLQAGIRVVLNCGNWIDGTCRLNRSELHTHGLSPQLDYAVRKWPQVPGITSYFIAGDDHEGWYQKDITVEVGQLLEDAALRAGRGDLRYLSYVEHDFLLPGGDRFFRFKHPGGGTAKSLSLKPQNIIDSYTPADTPELLCIGHYHKSEFIPSYRGVAVIQAGCACDQTVFMRKQNIVPHLGFWTIEAHLSATGRLTRILPEWTGGFSPAPRNRRFSIPTG